LVYEGYEVSAKNATFFVCEKCFNENSEKYIEKVDKNDITENDVNSLVSSLIDLLAAISKTECYQKACMQNGLCAGQQDIFGRLCWCQWQTQLYVNTFFGPIPCGPILCTHPKI